MTLNPLTPAQAEALRDSLETSLSQASSAAMRGYLADVRTATLRAVRSPLPNVLLAAAGDETPTLGWMATDWAEHVDTQIMSAVMSAFNKVYRTWTDRGMDMDSPALAGMRDYLANVRNRLVNGTYFGVTVYDDSFNRIRESIAESVAEGWSRRELSQRIANELAWETDGPYWRRELAKVDKQIDDILDPLGKPGNPIREQARLNDPRVNRLQNERSEIVKTLDAEKSVWKTRADLIARTESTGAANYGGLSALTAEGVATKAWVATGDPRTRPSHRAASGQEVSLTTPFMVGQALLQFPGDPSGPTVEIANCRCTMVGGDYLSSSDKDALKKIEEGEDFG